MVLNKDLVERIEKILEADYGLEHVIQGMDFTDYVAEEEEIKFIIEDLLKELEKTKYEFEEYKEDKEQEIQDFYTVKNDYTIRGIREADFH